MQAIFRKTGNAIDYTPDAAVAAGQVVVQGNVVGYAERDIAAGALGALTVGGIADVKKATGAITAGAAVYWDADGIPLSVDTGVVGALTTTATNNTFVGWAVIAAAELATTAKVKFFGSPAVTANHYGPLNNSIADPGDDEAIPVTSSGYVPIVTVGAAETRTLAVPTFAGQELLLTMQTDAGDCVVTVADPDFDGTNNTITFADIGDTVRLVAGISGAGFVWCLVSNVGAALSAV